MSELCFKINKKGIVTECLSQLIEGDLSVLVNKHLSEQNLPNVYENSDLRKAYKNLARQYHPDKNPNGREMFEKIHVAYELLASLDDHASGSGNGSGWGRGNGSGNGKGGSE
jgi:hypothetical protein